MKNPLILLFLVIFSVSNSFGQTVTIGTQTWTTKNLNVATFRNGDAIPRAKTDEEWSAAGENKQPAWCYYENKAANGTKYGKLYNWYAVVDARGLAPAGWHVPTDEEWTVLSTFLGGEDVAGKKMKSSSGWITKSGSNGTNSSGFMGRPGGYRDGSGSFDDVGDYGGWWSSSEDYESLAWGRGLYDGFSNLIRGSTNENNGFSVRCVRD